jgi:hypothetical protein
MPGIAKGIHKSGFHLVENPRICFRPVRAEQTQRHRHGKSSGRGPRRKFPFLESLTLAGLVLFFPIPSA